MRSDFTTAYIGLGSNLGDRAGNLLLAIRGFIEANFVVNQLSCIYETEPIDVDSDVNFLNMVAEVRVNGIKSSQMMARMLRIEYMLGRRDKTLKMPRTIDLDLLYFGRERIESPFLTLPHPRLHLRKFVLVPLAEIAASVEHPTLGKQTRELLRQCPDMSRVVRWEPCQKQRERALMPN